MLAGAKADVDATKREVRKSFIVICLCVVCLAVMFIGFRFYEEEGMRMSSFGTRLQPKYVNLPLLVVMGNKTKDSPLLMADSCLCLGQRLAIGISQRSVRGS
jgi:hypothetical protein